MRWHACGRKERGFHRPRNPNEEEKREYQQVKLTIPFVLSDREVSIRLFQQFVDETKHDWDMERLRKTISCHLNPQFVGKPMGRQWEWLASRYLHTEPTRQRFLDSIVRGLGGSRRIVPAFRNHQVKQLCD